LDIESCVSAGNANMLEREKRLMATLPNSGIKISQEYKDMAPEMLPNEFQALKESIKQHGLYYALVVNKAGILLDGHHRYEVCRMIGVKPRIEVRSFDDDLQEKLFICESAGRRRNLNEWQKIDLARSTEKVLKEIARQNTLANLKQNQNQNQNREQLPSRSNELVSDVAKAAAKTAGLSPATYKRARTIVEKGTEEQKQKLMLGKTSINKEYNVIRRLEKREQLVKEAEKDNLSLPDKVNLIYGDFRTVSSQIPDNSVDLIITDLPYDEGSLPLYKELAILSKRKLKPGGVFFPLYGDRLRRRFINYLENDGDLIENCTIHIKLQGNFARDYDKGIVRKQKDMLWYYKGPELITNGLLQNLIPSERSEKDLHDWQQSTKEAEAIISRLTFPDTGDLVLI
jgi:ParB-like nuclease domain